MNAMNETAGSARDSRPVESALSYAHAALGRADNQALLLIERLETVLGPDLSMPHMKEVEADEPDASLLVGELRKIARNADNIANALNSAISRLEV